MLETERLVLRPFELKDFDAIKTLYQHPAVCELLLHEPWEEHEAKEIFFEKLQGRRFNADIPFNLAVVYNEQVIGNIVIWYTGMRETAEIGYAFHPDFHGLGLATEAVASVLDYCFYQLKLHRVQANLDVRNTPSKKLCERIGMRQEGHFIEDYWTKGAWTSSYGYAILRSEWLAK